MGVMVEGLGVMVDGWWWWWMDSKLILHMLARMPPLVIYPKPQPRRRESLAQVAERSTSLSRDTMTPSMGREASIDALESRLWEDRAAARRVATPPLERPAAATSRVGYGVLARSRLNDSLM